MAISTCTICGSQLSESLETCSTCGEYIGPPNVRFAKIQELQETLGKRYIEALTIARKNDSDSNLSKFEEAVKNTSAAIINCDLDCLYKFITTDKELYSTYSLQVTSEIRKPAKPEDERKRLAIESAFFGSYAEKIRYAALSLDGSGLKSYGQYSIKLRDIAIRKRATLLEENTYHFCEKYKIPLGGKIPDGFISTWEDRNKLAVSKLSSRISKETPAENYAKILLYSEGNRKTDDFIEVHIYGAFDNNAIESIKGNSSAIKKHEKALLQNVKEHLNNKGKKWLEE